MEAKNSVLVYRWSVWRWWHVRKCVFNSLPLWLKWSQSCRHPMNEVWRRQWCAATLPLTYYSSAISVTMFVVFILIIHLTYSCSSTLTYSTVQRNTKPAWPLVIKYLKWLLLYIRKHVGQICYIIIELNQTKRCVAAKTAEKVLFTKLQCLL